MAALNPYMLKAQVAQLNKEINQLKAQNQQEQQQNNLLAAQNEQLQSQMLQWKQKPESEMQQQIAALRLQIKQLQKDKLRIKQQLEVSNSNEKLIEILKNVNSQSFKHDEAYIMKKYVQQQQQQRELEGEIADLKSNLEQAENDKQILLKTIQVNNYHQNQQIYKNGKKQHIQMTATAQIEYNQLKQDHSELKAAMRQIYGVNQSVQKVVDNYNQQISYYGKQPLNVEVANICRVNIELNNTVELQKVEIQSLKGQNKETEKHLMETQIFLQRAQDQIKQQKERSAAIIAQLEKNVQQLQQSCNGRKGEVFTLQYQLQRLKQQLGNE